MSIEILLDKRTSKYSPGETITGVVRVVSDEERHCKYLTILLEGIGRVKIFDTKYDFNKPESTQAFLVYKVEEVYLEETIQLSGGNEIVPKGKSDVPFSYTLPSSGLPCSYETKQSSALGGISYWITATMLTGGLDEMTHKLPFTVRGHLDLNKRNLESFQRFQQIETFRFCCLCCKSDLVNVILTIYKRALISREPIRFRVYVDNPSRNKLKPAKMELVTRVTCLAHGKLKTEERVLGKVEGPAVQKQSRITWDKKDFCVPVVSNIENGIPPTDLGDGCNIMHATYFLRFTMPRPKCEAEINICMALLIGTIPLDESFK